jgi:hypothetical protein
VFHRFEQVDKGIITGADVLDRLIQLGVTMMHTLGNKQGSYGKKDGEGSKNGIYRQE